MPKLPPIEILPPYQQYIDPETGQAIQQWYREGAWIHSAPAPIQDLARSGEHVAISSERLYRLACIVDHCIFPFDEQTTKVASHLLEQLCRLELVSHDVVKAARECRISSVLLSRAAVRRSELIRIGMDREMIRHVETVARAVETPDVRPPRSRTVHVPITDYLQIMLMLRHFLREATKWVTGPVDRDVILSIYAHYLLDASLDLPGLTFRVPRPTDRLDRIISWFGPRPDLAAALLEQEYRANDQFRELVQVPRTGMLQTVTRDEVLNALLSLDRQACLAPDIIRTRHRPCYRGRTIRSIQPNHHFFLPGNERFRGSRELCEALYRADPQACTNLMTARLFVGSVTMDAARLFGLATGGLPIRKLLRSIKV